jgi:8-oxo-dGTP pyrophosphatase MutT (NUDIX family)
VTSPAQPARRRGGDQIIPRPAAWRPGAPAPWTDRVPARFELAAVAHAVAARGEGRPPTFLTPNSREAAVLVALFPGAFGAEVVLTRRSSRMLHHRGEISFPGGGVDPGETPVEAALREAFEEVALDPALVTVVGELDHISTMVSRNVIVPVVATLTARPEMHPEAAEVDRIFTVPLVELAGADVYREELWGAAPFDRPIHFFELDDETVWGATGRILLQLLSVAAGVQP